MSKEDLIPISSRPTHEIRAMGRKGGSVRSPRKKLAARIRELKKKGLTKPDAKLLSDMMISGDVLDLDILIGLKKLTSSVDEKTKQGAYALLLKLSEKLHGTKKIENQINIQNNTQVNLSFKELEEIYKQYS